MGRARPKPGPVRCRVCACVVVTHLGLGSPSSTKMEYPLGLILYYQGKDIYTQNVLLPSNVGKEVHHFLLFPCLTCSSSDV